MKTSAQCQGWCPEVTCSLPLQAWEGAFLGTGPAGPPLTGWGWRPSGERPEVRGQLGMRLLEGPRPQVGRQGVFGDSSTWGSRAALARWVPGLPRGWPRTLEPVCHTGPRVPAARCRTPPPPHLQKRPSPWLWPSLPRLPWRPPQRQARPAPPQPPWQAPQDLPWPSPLRPQPRAQQPCWGQ